MRRGSALLSIAVASTAIAACGSSKKSSTAAPTTSSAKPSGTLALSITEAGKTAKYSGPTTVTGGLVHLSLHNAGKAPHAAQLIRVDPPHTVMEALRAIGGGSNKTPDWLHAGGGLGPAAPGLTVNATLNLPAGNYAIADIGGPNSSGPPAVTTLTVTPGTSGTLPATPTTVTAAATGKDKYKWQISGPLKAGPNTITFASKGKSTLHLLAAARITGNPSQAQLIKALESNGPPPPFLDQTSFYSTAALDSGNSEVTPLPLLKPGRYILFCPLHDRDGGKPHFAEGLLTTIVVK